MKLTSKLAAAAMVAAALVAPSSALAGKSHHLKLYKVEMHVDIEGQDDTYNVACKNGDLALDGMWRVDTVEQDNDYVYDGPGATWSTTFDPPDHADWDVLRSVRPIYVVRNGPSSYDFRFVPEAGGDVAMKLFITCLGEKTESIGGHTHTFAFGPGNGSSPVSFASPTFTSPACPSGSIVAQPSFSITAGDADLQASYPNPTATTWTWKFANATASFTGAVSWSCLPLKSSNPSSGPNHKHRIVKNLAKIFTPNDAIKKTSVGEKQAICGEHYKGMIGGWDITAGPNPWQFRHLHLFYLGMDPRIKSRAFKFINKDSVQQSPDLYLVCFKDRTT
jgi:hypothetical protein